MYACGFPLSRERRSALGTRHSVLGTRRLTLSPWRRSSSYSQRAPVADEVSNEWLLQRGRGGKVGIEMMRCMDGPFLCYVTKATI